jgi:hypothetical protein
MLGISLHSYTILMRKLQRYLFPCPRLYGGHLGDNSPLVAEPAWAGSTLPLYEIKKPTIIPVVPRRGPQLFRGWFRPIREEASEDGLRSGARCRSVGERLKKGGERKNNSVRPRLGNARAAQLPFARGSTFPFAKGAEERIRILITE